MLTVGDLKGRITKFLEDLIEKHPETLDAIENVRMNRLSSQIPPLHDLREVSVQKNNNTLKYFLIFFYMNFF